MMTIWQIRSIRIFVCCYALLWLPNASAAGQDYANEIFTNVKHIKIEGDLIGWRIQLIRSSQRAYALVQGFEGEPQPPCLVPARIDGNGDLEFEMAQNCDVRGRFVGRIKGNALIGEFKNGMRGPDGEVVMTLRRVLAR